MPKDVASNEYRDLQIDVEDILTAVQRKAQTDGNEREIFDLLQDVTNLNKVYSIQR